MKSYKNMDCSLWKQQQQQQSRYGEMKQDPHEQSNMCIAASFT